VPATANWCPARAACGPPPPGAGTAAQPPAGSAEDIWPGWRLHDLREIILHVITGTACHARHLDAARELIDGRTWMA
jgi:Protein of unknown function (DUF664)